MASRQYRVVSRCSSSRGTRVSIDTGWMSYRQCIRHIIGRHGHIPPFSFPSSIADSAKLQRRYGD